MKVSTDGVLLGAWAAGGLTILDIGTGTGLLALMLAQRYPKARVQAVEIEPAAAHQAKDNFEASPFAERLTLFKGPVQAFPPQRFDAIVCNPPYFSHNQQISQVARRLARQDAHLDFPSLAQALLTLLSPKGKASLVLPMEREQLLAEAFQKRGLYKRRRCQVHSRRHKAPKRVLVEYQKDAGGLEEEKLLLHEGEDYSQAFKSLTAAFYLPK